MKHIQEEQNLFMASISHELRTPLTSILGYGELLENTNLDHKQEEYLSRMLHSSKYLLSLVGDFLDIVKIKKNDIKLDQKEVRLHTVLTECVDVIKANLHKDVAFEVDIPFLNYTILADDRRIKQVMLNFLSNAAKFTQSGRIKFYVKEILEIDKNVKITVNIEDTGAGMSQEVQQALFDPFITGDSTQGFGLGLFISKEIIDLMDGEISVTSKEGEGSIFSVSFTVKKAQEKEFSKVLSDKKILMLSDEDALIQKTDTLLKNFNASFYSYSATDDISNTLRDIFSNAREYDIAVFDMNTLSCPVSDIVSTLRMIHPNIKCVALLDKHSFNCTSSFDRLIDTPSTAKDIIFELEELSAAGSSTGSSSIDFSHLKVLVVEDVEMSSDYIKEMLFVSFSISCDTAINGLEAVKKVETNDYDIVFMDIRMPVMDGYKATKEIRKFNKRVPIVCMSADVYEKDIEAAKNSGMNSFIEKPLDKDEVKQSFLNLIEGDLKDTVLKGQSLSRSKKGDATIASGKCDPLKLKEKAYGHLGKSFDATVAKSLVQTAIQSIEKYIHSIKFNMVEEDMYALAEDFHAIKGVLANLGLKEQAASAGSIQQLCQEGDFQKSSAQKREFIMNMDCFLNELKKDY